MGKNLLNWRRGFVRDRLCESFKLPTASIIRGADVCQQCTDNNQVDTESNRNCEITSRRTRFCYHFPNGTRPEEYQPKCHSCGSHFLPFPAPKGRSQQDEGR